MKFGGGRKIGGGGSGARANDGGDRVVVLLVEWEEDLHELIVWKFREFKVNLLGS